MRRHQFPVLLDDVIIGCKRLLSLGLGPVATYRMLHNDLIAMYIRNFR